MAMTVDQLRALFPSGGSGGFELDTGRLGLAGDSGTFEHFPGGVLTLGQATADSVGLAVTGTVAFAGQEMPATARFFSSGSAVTGLLFEARPATWLLETAVSRVDLTELAPRGRDLRLLLAAGAAAAEAGECPAAGPWAAFHLGSAVDKSVEFRAELRKDSIGAAHAVEGRPVLVAPLLEALGEYDVELPGPLVEWLEEIQLHQHPMGKTDNVMVTAGAPLDQGTGANPVEVLVLRTTVLGRTGQDGKVKATTVAMLRVRTDWDAAGLPLVGPMIGNGLLSMPALQIMYISEKNLSAEDVTKINRVITEYNLGPLQQLPTANEAAGVPLTKGVNAAVYLSVMGTPSPALVITVPPKFGPEPEGKEKPKLEHTFAIGKPLGPVYLAAIVVRYDFKKGLLIELQGQVTIGALTWEVAGLGFYVGMSGGFPLLPFLHGMAIEATAADGLIGISGGLSNREPDDPALDFQLAGLLLVKAMAVQIGAQALWARSTEGWHSVFIYGEASLIGGASLFGPPPFTVTGFSAGFGVNSSFKKVPDGAEIAEFPLVARLDAAQALPGMPAPTPYTPEDALKALTGPTGWIRPQQGQYWIAAGVKFTSFGFIETKALAVLELGDSVKAMLLGRTSVSLPRNVNPAARSVAKVNIGLSLGFDSAAHCLSMDAALLPGSYVLDPSIELTGGIAVYVWTGGGRAGDFAISLGGYHPSYNVPVHYPNPKRLGIVWSPASDITVRAEAYAAITPAAFMFGGRLAAVYDKGVFSAWFTAHLDVLVQWKPFYLDVSLGISIGVAATVKVWFVRVRISVEVGIDLHLWLPPFGGRATVKLWFISFSFGFGSSRDSTPSVDWPEFRAQIPAPVRVAANEGLLTDIDQEEIVRRAATKEPTLVSSAGFSFTTEAGIPASHLYLNDRLIKQSNEGTIDIRPMRKTGVTSAHRVTVTKDTAPFDPVEHYWTVKEVTGSVAPGLWGKPLAKPGDALKGEQLLEGRYTGLKITLPPPDYGTDTGPVTSQALSYDGLPDGRMPLRVADAAGPAPVADPQSIRTVVDTVADPAVAARRGAAHRALARLGAGTGPDTDSPLTGYADLAGRSLTTPPLTTTATR
ncbi:DUF6603 domain-containing protein [Yinghuangia seranimata]|uniref:DUF6603 domain-containing protein n=1 Tax=Yinghuangia seranimata TaxID=408067 RepID=UPI00248B7265|nr:DUF6603 domain-containing protein [Yinghuangia seranimata]MDI2130034.1 hypothetical protein [Yinghuangia seranimata]